MRLLYGAFAECAFPVGILGCPIYSGRYERLQMLCGLVGVSDTRKERSLLKFNETFRPHQASASRISCCSNSTPKRSGLWNIMTFPQYSGRSIWIILGSHDRESAELKHFNKLAYVPGKR